MVTILLLLLLMQSAPAPKPALAPVTIDARQLTVTTSQSRTSAPAGGRVSLYLDVVPKPKMHVYAPEQKGGYIRIELTLDRHPAIRPLDPVFPKASDYYFAPLKETFRVYNAPFRITQDILLTRGAGRGVDRVRNRVPFKLSGTLRYQACDDQVCYRPENVPVSWSVTAR